MFTGIIECLGRVENCETQGANLVLWISSPMSGELKVDQSVSHSGVCLTVEETRNGQHRVTAIEETIAKTDLSSWKKGSIVNLERCLQVNARLDGHFVQGHVDCTAICKHAVQKDGSWEFELEFPASFAPLVIEKGSVAVNGISLTAFNVKKDRFTIAIIPYTFEHTNISTVKEGTSVNLEFDILGKYITRSLQLTNS